MHEVAEGIHGTFHYHLRDPAKSSTRALCGALVMPTRIPLTAWGTVSHLNERWCPQCSEQLRSP